MRALSVCTDLALHFLGSTKTEKMASLGLQSCLAEPDHSPAWSSKACSCISRSMQLRELSRSFKLGRCVGLCGRLQLALQRWAEVGLGTQAFPKQNYTRSAHATENKVYPGDGEAARWQDRNHCLEPKRMLRPPVCHLARIWQLEPYLETWP